MQPLPSLLQGSKTQAPRSHLLVFFCYLMVPYGPLYMVPYATPPIPPPSKQGSGSQLSPADILLLPDGPLCPLHMHDPLCMVPYATPSIPFPRKQGSGSQVSPSDFLLLPDGPLWSFVYGPLCTVPYATCRHPSSKESRLRLPSLTC